LVDAEVVFGVVESGSGQVRSCGVAVGRIGNGFGHWLWGEKQVPSSHCKKRTAPLGMTTLLRVARSLIRSGIVDQEVKRVKLGATWGALAVEAVL